MFQQTKFAFSKIARDNFICENKIARIRNFERLSADEMLTNQKKMLASTLRAASSALPAYQSIRIPSSKDTIDYLRESVHVITKTNLLTRKTDYYPNAGKIKPWSLIGKTSGTTGTPLEVIRSVDSIVAEQAFVRRHWHWSGFRDSDRRVTLRGNSVAPVERNKPPFWYLNRVDQQLLVSTRHLKREFMESIIEEIRKFGPQMLQAYPSAAYELASFLRERNQYINIPYVYTASEVLYPHQKELIESVFKANIFDMYGMAERVAFIAQCEYGNYHVNPAYSFVEILDEENRPTDDWGFLTGTTFHNMRMPLLRYKTTDVTRWKHGVCPCGRHFPMVEPIQGRAADTIYGGSGERISPAIITFVFKGLTDIEQSQVVQVSASEWVVRVVPGPKFRNETSVKLLENIRVLVDSEIIATVELVAEIPRTKAGKHRWILNEWRSHS
jgi:phenylacetate-CoA ligase